MMEEEFAHSSDSDSSMDAHSFDSDYRPSSPGSDSTDSDNFNNEPAYFNTSNKFADISRTRFYIDKTLLIREIMLDDTKNFVITAPKGYIKSTNLDMLRTFFQIPYDEDNDLVEIQASESYALFTQRQSNGQFRFNIARDEVFLHRHLGKYPVLFLDFLYYYISSWRPSFDRSMKDTFEDYAIKYLSDSHVLTSEDQMLVQKYFSSKKGGWLRVTKTNLVDGLHVLLKLVYKHFRVKIIVIIDNYDVGLFHTLWEHNEDIYENIEHLSLFLNGIFTSDFVLKTVIAGKTYFATGAISDTARICTFLTGHPFEHYFFLSTQEAIEVCNRYYIPTRIRERLLGLFGRYRNLSAHNVVNLNGFFTTLSEYCTTNQFNEIQIAQKYIESSVFDTYFYILRSPLILYLIEDLLKCSLIMTYKRIPFKFSDLNELRQILRSPRRGVNLMNYDMFLLFLFESGVLAVAAHSQLRDDLTDYYVQIPNLSTYFGFIHMIKQYYKEFLYNIDCESVSRCASYLNEIAFRGNFIWFSRFRNELTEIVQRLSVHTVVNEEMLHSIVFAILCRSQFLMEYKHLVGTSRPRIIAHKDRVGLLIEVAWNANVAISKMIYDRYSSELFHLNVRHTVFLGLHICLNRTVELRYAECRMGMDRLLQA